MLDNCEVKRPNLKLGFTLMHVITQYRKSLKPTKVIRGDNKQMS